MSKIPRKLLPAVVAVATLGIAAPGHAADTSFARIAHGRDLVNAGDCVACHTAPGGKPFAGGRAIETPFGVIYSPNITPDRDTGIGAWSDDDFYRAMHEGIDPKGDRLYPAFPYPYFTKLTRDDVDAIRAYLATLAPVKHERRQAELMWPLNHRVFMRGWDWLFFEPGTFRPDPQKSAQWNRGAYLVEGAGHCGACHTPTNALGAPNTDQPLAGNRLQHWFAPKLANDPHNGLGTWTAEDIVAYLKTGRNRHSGATGLMAEVVANSTSKLPDSDLQAIATYIKDVSATQEASPAKAEDNIMASGQAIFAESCAACHKADGSGVPQMFPPLAHNANVQSSDPTTVIRVILQGARTVATDARPTPSSMPAYGWKLDDAEIAAVATYVRNAWGNHAAPVDAGAVGKLRKALHRGTSS